MAKLMVLSEHGLDVERVQRLYQESILTPFVPA